MIPKCSSPARISTPVVFGSKPGHGSYRGFRGHKKLPVVKKINREHVVSKMATSSDGRLIIWKMGQKKRLKWWKFNWKPVHWDFYTRSLHVFSTWGLNSLPRPYLFGYYIFSFILTNISCGKICSVFLPKILIIICLFLTVDITHNTKRILNRKRVTYCDIILKNRSCIM